MLGSGEDVKTDCLLFSRKCVALYILIMLWTGKAILYGSCAKIHAPGMALPHYLMHAKLKTEEIEQK